MNDHQNFKKSFLVTGGNRGIGEAIVAGLAKNREHQVLMGCRRISDAPEALLKSYPNVKAISLDLSKPRELDEQIQDILKQYAIGSLINNAGVLFNESILEISEKDFSQALQVNLIAVHQLIKAFLPEMQKQDYGRIVNVSSGWGSFSEGLSGPYSYSLTKAALNAITFNLAHKLPKNIKINSLCPGWVKTRMGGADAPRTPEQGADTALWLATLPNDGPSGRFFRDRKAINW